MLKYVDTKVVFQEIPDEITLAINISNCPCRCKGCHSPYLAEDIGEVLTTEVLEKFIEDNNGITCVAFMGGDSEPWEIHTLAMFIRESFPNIKIAWYSGRDKLHSCIELNLQDFDYIKTGPYIKNLGPLTSKNTNQRFYKIGRIKTIPMKCIPIDITHKFWK